MKGTKYGSVKRRHAQRIFTAVLFLGMAFLVGCPSAFDSFPNEEASLLEELDATDNSASDVTEQPYWLTRNRGSNDEWRVISGSTPQSFSQDQEIIARSQTPDARVFYATGGMLDSPDLPDYIASEIEMDESSPLILEGSSASQTYTAIALAPSMLPSLFTTVTITIDARAASSPTFSLVPSNSYTSAQTLEIYNPTSGTTAHYEFATADTDGDGDIDLDDVSTPTSASTTYTAPLSILANHGDVYCIKVMAHDASGIYSDSSIASGCYGRLNVAATPTFNLLPSYNYTSAQTLEIIPPTSGTTAHYEFATADTDGDGDIDQDDVIDPTSASTTYTAPISILANDEDVYCIKVMAHDASDIYSDSSIASGCYGRLNVAATPTFNLQPSYNYTSAQTLEIISPASGTVAHYEFATADINGDGDIDLDDVSTPTSASTAYTAPISILVNKWNVYCIKVMAHDASGIYSDSSIASGCYRRLRVASSPSFNRRPFDSFTSALTLGINSPSWRTVVLYEFATADTDGDGDIDLDDVSDPTSASTAYTAPISILTNDGDTYCIKVMAHHPDGIYANSPVVSGCYRRRPLSAPAITAGVDDTSVTVTITTAPGATIYYRAAFDATTDLSAAIDPDDSTTYTGTGTSVAYTFSISELCRIKAMAVLADGRRTPETAIHRYDYGGITDIDADDDGLIDIRNLDMFNNMRFNLAGTTYDDEAADSGTGDIGIITGGPTSATANCPTDSNNDGIFLCGYELMGDLDFAQGSSYASGTVNTTWCPDTSNNCIGSSSQAGFPGIGPVTGGLGVTGFTGIFEGNGNSISNFYYRDTANTNHAYIGLFTYSSGTIRNIAVEANLFGGTVRGARFGNRIGGLVGYNRGGTITASSTSGSVNGGDGGGNEVGGLVGDNRGTTITASHATGNVNGGDGGGNDVGGLVGSNSGTITASHATGNVDGGDGNGDNVGGLVGHNSGPITESHATGNASGGDGDYDEVGGLVGDNNGAITESHATGNVDGGDGNSDSVGGLAGWNSKDIIASYATGDAYGGDGDQDEVGGLVGVNHSTIKASYATGNADGGDGDRDRCRRPGRIQRRRHYRKLCHWQCLRGRWK